jgi:hypothetical protein
MALSSGCGEVVGRRSCPGEVSLRVDKTSIALLTSLSETAVPVEGTDVEVSEVDGTLLSSLSETAGPEEGTEVEVSEVDRTGRFFCAGEADTGMASILNHSESGLDIVRSRGCSVSHGIWTSKSPRISSGAVVPSDSVNSARHISLSICSSGSGFLLPRAIDICDPHSGKTNAYEYKDLPLAMFSGSKLFSILPSALRDPEVK